MTGPDGVDLASLAGELSFRRLWETASPWNWLMLLVAVLVGLLAGKVCQLVLLRLAHRFEARAWRSVRHMALDLVGPAKLTLLTAGVAIGLSEGLSGAEISPALARFTAGTLRLLWSIAAVWYVYNLMGLVDLLFVRLRGRRESLLDRQLAPMVRKTLRTIVIVLATLFVARSVFGQDVGAWLAGLGLAGLAISLAAQDSLKNFFGSITILLDHPFQVGDRIVFGGYDGQIEEIGFRSTKIRISAGHLVTIPNSKIVSDPVENVSRRGFIRRNLTLVLSQGTPPDTVELALRLVRGVLAEPGIREPIQVFAEGESYPPRVYLADVGDEKPRLTVTYWYAPPNHWDYMDHAEKVSLRIYQVLFGAGLSFAPPPPAPPQSPASTKPDPGTE